MPGRTDHCVRNLVFTSMFDSDRDIPARPKQSCPLTGLHAKYLDPRTNVPYANVRAYKTLTKILDHGYVWSESLGRYVGEEGERRALGLEGKGRKGKEKEKGKMRSREVNAMDLS